MYADLYYFHSTYIITSAGGDLEMYVHWFYLEGLALLRFSLPMYGTYTEILYRQVCFQIQKQKIVTLSER